MWEKGAKSVSPRRVGSVNKRCGVCIAAVTDGVKLLLFVLRLLIIDRLRNFCNNHAPWNACLYPSERLDG